jgi:hypothetical protein
MINGAANPPAIIRRLYGKKPKAIPLAKIDNLPD